MFSVELAVSTVYRVTATTSLCLRLFERLRDGEPSVSTLVFSTLHIQCLNLPAPHYPRLACCISFVSFFFLLTSFTQLQIKTFTSNSDLTQSFTIQFSVSLSMQFTGNNFLQYSLQLYGHKFLQSQLCYYLVQQQTQLPGIMLTKHKRC